MPHVGPDVVGVVRRVRELVIRVGVEMKDGVGTTLGEARECVEKPREQLPRLVAAVREDDETVLEAELPLRCLTVVRRRERLEVDAVRDQLGVDAAALGDVATVTAHRHRNVDLPQQLDPARRQEPIGRLAVDWEVEDPRRLDQLELTAHVRRGEGRKPPHVRKSDDGVGTMTEEERVERVTAERVAVDRDDATPVPLVRFASLPAEDRHPVTSAGKAFADKAGHVAEA